MPTVSRWYFLTATCFLVVGILVGLHMSVTQNHAAVGAHAHINLLGWVTMAIFGAFHALNPQGAGTGLAKAQYGIYTGGVVVMTPALYLLLTGSPAWGPVVGAASLVVFLGVLMFAVIVFRTRAA